MKNIFKKVRWNCNSSLCMIWHSCDLHKKSWNYIFRLTKIFKTIAFSLNSGRDLHHQDIIDISQNPVKKNLQSVNHVHDHVLVRVLIHVLGWIGMITNGRVEYRHQNSGNAVIQKISFSIVFCTILYCQIALFL